MDTLDVTPHAQAQAIQPRPNSHSFFAVDLLELAVLELPAEYKGEQLPCQTKIFELLSVRSFGEIDLICSQIQQMVVGICTALFGPFFCICSTETFWLCLLLFLIIRRSVFVGFLDQLTP